MKLAAFIVCFVLIKLSLLGLGVLSIGTAVVALLCLKLKLLKLNSAQSMSFKRIYRVALWGHVSVYILFIVKMLFIDGLEDIPMFVASHLIAHHIISAGIAATLTFLTIKIFADSNHRVDVKRLGK